MLEKTKTVSCDIFDEPFSAEIKVLTAIEADECLTAKISDVELVKKFCLKVEGLDKTMTIDEYLDLPGSFMGYKKIVEGISKWAWLGGEAKNA
jgi:hypothetical protein